MDKTPPESQSDWRKRSNERFDRFIQAAEEDDLQDVVDCVAGGEKSIEDFSVSVTEATKDSDWGEWADDFNNGSIDLLINLPHRVILPPRHDVHIVFAADRVVNKILLKYEYYFDHTSVIILEGDDDIDPLIKYVKSLVFIKMFQHLLDRKEQSILRIPLFGRMLHRLFFMVYTAKDQELIYETKSTELMHYLEEWIETYLDDFDKEELKENYDRYFAGVPEERRGIWISM